MGLSSVEHGGMMNGRNVIAFICIFSCLAAADSQVTQEISEVVNVEVPVRVFQGGRFVEDLGIDDFELYEDGRRQNIEAVYLIRNRKIVRSPVDETSLPPRTAQTYILAFILTDYLPKIEYALNLFFERTFHPGDTLIVTTPLKTYNMKKESTDRLEKTNIKSQLTALLKTDIRSGNREYKEIIKDLMLATDKPNEYNMLMQRLRMLRYIHQGNLEATADFLKGIEGRKHIFLFYQKEMVPALNENANELLSTLMPGLYDLSSHFDYLERPFDFDKMKRLFSDSSISIHFLYITKGISELRGKSKSNFVEKSQDIFQAFYEMAEGTGGYRESSANLSSSFSKAMDASDNYYLLYYSPSDKTQEGGYRRIEVKVPGRRCRIYHRDGYFH